MSRFEELCQTYALARQKTELSRQACQKFTEGLISGMSDYFQTSIVWQKESFDERGVMHFETNLTLYENPNNRENSFSEVIVIFWSLENILDNYILTIYPWMKEFKLFENEWDKFELVYEFVFERVKEAYLDKITWSEEEKTTVRRIEIY
jgi:hypothetical protein